MIDKSKQAILPTQVQEKIKKEIIEALKLDSGNIIQSVSRGTENYFCIESAVIHDFNLETIKKYDLDFIDCVFRCKTILNESDINFSFLNCSFDQTYIAFGQSIIQTTLHFYHCKFLGDFYISNFRQGVFYAENCFFNNIYLANSRLPEKTTFKNCKFQCGLNLQNAHSDGLISFYGTIFWDCPNFSRIQFENICLINTKLAFGYKKLDDEITKTWKKEKIYLFYVGGKHFVANDFRDSFRLFKNTLAKENNVLDASNYHRIELYCKEIELDSKPQKTLRDWIDWAQLFFYRLTSDHHTDLLKIIGWVLTTIACFGVLLGSLKYGLDFEKFAKNHQLEFLPNIFSTIAMWLHTDIRHICAWLYDLFFVSLIFSFSRFFSSLMVVCLIIAIQPKYILGLGGLIGGSIQMQGMAENFLFVLYSILMFLMLFSLQKTARKNSIIPS